MRRPIPSALFPPVVPAVIVAAAADRTQLLAQLLDLPRVGGLLLLNFFEELQNVFKITERALKLLDGVERFLHGGVNGDLGRGLVRRGQFERGALFAAFLPAGGVWGGVRMQLARFTRFTGDAWLALLTRLSGWTGFAGRTGFTAFTGFPALATATRGVPLFFSRQAGAQGGFTGGHVIDELSRRGFRRLRLDRRRCFRLVLGVRGESAGCHLARFHGRFSGDGGADGPWARTAAAPTPTTTAAACLFRRIGRRRFGFSAH